MCEEADDGQTLGSGIIDSTPVNNIAVLGSNYHFKIKRIFKWSGFPRFLVIYLTLT